MVICKPSQPVRPLPPKMATFLNSLAGLWRIKIVFVRSVKGFEFEIVAEENFDMSTWMNYSQAFYPFLAKGSMSQAPRRRCRLWALRR
jgi:hypothetical protein